MNIHESLSMKDSQTHEKHGLRGHVSIYRVNRETNEKTLWFEEDNVIDIAGYQFILMKMFNLYLDSEHMSGAIPTNRDTNLVIPDLNTKMNIGKDPQTYSAMTENIPSNFFVQGFMVGNGGSGEDAITTKNTDYSFINLRNPVPFRQEDQLAPGVAAKYLGKIRVSSNAIDPNSYFIKKFDERPHIYHYWWNNDQEDPTTAVTPEQLGPNPSSSASSNRIVTYCECKLSLDKEDCVKYFQANPTQDAVLNELGLVAYDAVQGQRSQLEMVYDDYVSDFIYTAFKSSLEEEDFTKLNTLKTTIATAMSTFSTLISGTKIEAFLNAINVVISSDNISTIKEDLTDATNNIGVEAYYNHIGELVYCTDNFKSSLDDIELTADEAQRIKLVTYYTFKPLALSDNCKIEIDYRIYAN